MIKNKLHQNYCEKHPKIVSWYNEKKSGLQVPIYSSYDIRDAGFKISNVDANIYPAGFNNICPTDKESAVDLFKQYIVDHYGSSIKKIVLLTEEHTNNPYYWENVHTIKSLLESSGIEIRLAFPRALSERLTVISSTGQSLDVFSGYGQGQMLQEFKPDLIISNNDFSDAHLEWSQSHNIPINPPRELGWYQRKKSRYFKHYNNLISEFAEICGFDPFLLNVDTEYFEHFDLADENSIQQLADKVDARIAFLKNEYEKRGISEKPVLFVKNNAGTYGLAVIRVESGAEVLDWNNKSRKKMKAAKGGRDVVEVIIQEGIPTRVQSDGATAEPVIYMVGCKLAGGFLRTHGEKSNTESLNSPGAVYKKLCVSDLNVSLNAAPLENVYGWSAKIGLLAIGLEAKEMGVSFKNYKQGTNCIS
jgi:glutamate--cysteine ligase